jgi:ribosomal protein L24
MALAKIKKGDTVIVLAGKDKGKSGEVTAVMPKDSKVVVSGVNVAVRHRKASQANPHWPTRNRASQRVFAWKPRTARRSAWP